MDDAPLSVGTTIIFPNDDKINAQHIWKVSHVSGLISLTKVGDANLNPAGVEDGQTGFVPITLSQGDQVNIKAGLFGYGKEYWWNNNELVLCQVKEALHQEPLSKMYDDQGQEFTDQSIFPNTSFKRKKIFKYKVGTGVNDTKLGFIIFTFPWNKPEIFLL